MAISSTNTFNLDISDLMEEAYERAGVALEGAYDYRSAKRSIDLILLEWQNRNIDVWMTEQFDWDQKLDDGEGTTDYSLKNEVSEYSIRMGTVDILDVIIRTGSAPGSGALLGKFASGWQDTRLRRLNEREYATITNKDLRTTTGEDGTGSPGVGGATFPSSYYVSQHEITGVGSDGQKGKIAIYPSPSASTSSPAMNGDDFNMIIFRTKRIADTGLSALNNIEVPGPYLPALAAGMAYRVAMKYEESGGRVPALKSDYDEQVALLLPSASPNDESSSNAPAPQQAMQQQVSAVRGRDGQTRISRGGSSRRKM